MCNLADSTMFSLVDLITFSLADLTMLKELEMELVKSKLYLITYTRSARITVLSYILHSLPDLVRFVVQLWREPCSSKPTIPIRAQFMKKSEPRGMAASVFSLLTG